MIAERADHAIMKQSLSYEPDGARADTRMDAAVALLLRLQAELPGISEHELASRAIDATFCTNLALGTEAGHVSFGQHSRAIAGRADGS